MAASSLVDLVKIYSRSTGTGAITLGTAVGGYRGTEALENGATYSYSIQQDDQFETGKGTFLDTGNVLVRTPLTSSNGGAAIDLQPNAAVAFVALAEDILARDVLQPLYGYGPPLSGQGLPGQVYYDLSPPVTLYGPKDALAGWGSGVILQGSPGTAAAYNTVDELKAADPSALFYALVTPNGLVNYGLQPGDYSQAPLGPPDNDRVVALDAVPSSTAALVRQGASAISTKRPGSTSRVMTQEEKNSQTPVVVDEYVKNSNSDQTLAFSQAINDSRILGRPLAFINDFSIKSVSIPNGTIVRPHRPGATLNILDDGTLQGQQIVLDGVESIVFEDVTLTSTAASRSGVYGNMMLLGGTENVLFNRFRFGRSSSAGLWAANSKNITVRDSWVYDTYADGLQFNRGCQDILVERTEGYNCGDDVFAFVGYLKEGSADRPMMTNCRVVRCIARDSNGLGSGIVFLGVDGFEATGNLVENMARNGISVTREIDTAVATHYSRNGRIVGNTIRNPATGGSGRAIFLQDTRNVELDGNDSDGGYDHAIGAFGVIVDVRVLSGRHGGQQMGSGFAHIQEPSTSPLLIKELFTDYGEAVTEARSAAPVLGPDVQFVVPTGQPTIRLEGQAGKPIQRATIASKAQIKTGGAANGIVAAYCDDLSISDVRLTPSDGATKSTGNAIQATGCARLNITNATNIDAADAGVVLLGGAPRYKISGLRSENGAVGILADNTSKGIIDQCYIGGNSAGARINTGGAVLGTNVETI